MEGRRPVGRPKKTGSKVVEEDMRKLNITEDMAEDRKLWMKLISRPTPGKLGTVNKEEEDDDDIDRCGGQLLPVQLHPKWENADINNNNDNDDDCTRRIMQRFLNTAISLPVKKQIAQLNGFIFPV